MPEENASLLGGQDWGQKIEGLRMMKKVQGSERHAEAGFFQRAYISLQVRWSFSEMRGFSQSNSKGRRSGLTEGPLSPALFPSLSESRPPQ